MSLIFGPDKRLRQISAEVEDEEFGEDLVQLTDSMLKIMKSFGGIGLSAIQVGLPKRVVVAEVEGTEYRMINPVILSLSEDESEFSEGCLSFPAELFKLKRPEGIRLKWKSPNGESHEEDFDGLEARVFQHEIDHLDGITVYDKVSSLKKRLYKKKAEKLNNKIKNYMREVHANR